MEYAVSSWFVEQAASENPPVKRVFTIGDSDYTDFVLRWPSITRQWNELKPTNVTISLANEAQTFNFFRDVKTKIQDTCRVKIGFRDKPWDSGSWNFTNTLDGFTAVNGGLVVSGSEVTLTVSASDPQFFTPSLSLIGANSYLVMARLKRVESVAWEGNVFYATSGHAFVSSYRAFTALPAGIDSGYVTAIWDMRSLAVGDGADWLTNTITRVQFDFTQVDTGKFSVDWIGFATSDRTEELIAPFTGKVTGVEYSDGACSLRITDKVQGLSDRIVGTSNSAAIFSSSNLLASDIAWTLCTCYGQLSAVASSSNVDIDYASWLAWAAVFSSDTVTMGARFTGQKVTECLRKLAEHTQSAVFLSDDRLTFFRWTTANTRIVTLDSRHIKGVNADLKADGIVNKQWVEFLYNPSSENWSASVFAADTPSVNSYGTREYVEKDESVWYVSSASALNLAQRRLYTGAQPVDGAEIKTVLVPLHLQVGDTISAVDPLLELSAGWRIMKHTLNLEDGSMNLSIDASQVATPFILDYSALDGADLLQ